MKKSVIGLLNFKIKIPRKCRYSLERNRLVENFFKTDASVLVLHGKSGYGKTELARQYCERFPDKVFWYSLDTSDNDVWKFLTNLDRLFSTAVQWPAFGAGGRGGFACYQYILSTFSERLESHMEQTFLLVFDALESISSDKILAFINMLVANLPDNLKLAFTTRGDIPDFISRYVVSGVCLILDEEELAFTETEQHLLAGRILSCEKQVQAGIIDECSAWLQGWPAGLVLALHWIEKRQLKKGAVNWPLLFQDGMINSFIASEVFQPLSEAEKDFLVKTSGMPELKDSICDRVLQINYSGTMIARLLQKKLLHSGIEHGIVRICHHEALRLFLCMQTERMEAAEMIRKSAECYLEERLFAQAVSQAVKIKDTALVIKVMEQYGSEILAEKADQVLPCCIRFLEKDVGIMGEKRFSGQNPLPGPEVLGIAAQYYYKNNEPDKMEKYLNQADSFFGKENKFGMYRGLYKGLLKYREDPAKYQKQINNSLFLLAENHYQLPFLKESELDILNRLEAEQKQELLGSLKVNFFGDFQVLVGKEQKPLSWRTRKGSELFACLAASKGQAIGRKQLLEKLWSDGIPDNAVSMLHNMLYNIRKELSAYHLEDLIRYKDKRYSINMKMIETDLTEIRFLTALVDKTEITELKRHKERFLVYWGRFLDDLDNQWMMEEREYYDTRFLEGCTMLAREAAAVGQFQEAVCFLKNAMIVNSYSEDLAGKLLKCYGAMHNLKMVKTEYDRFASLLKRDLELKPGRKLEEIYKEALSA